MSGNGEWWGQPSGREMHPGGVNPTLAHETMSETYPETAGQSQNETVVEAEEQNRVAVGIARQTGKGRQRAETTTGTKGTRPSSHGPAGIKDRASPGYYRV